MIPLEGPGENCFLPFPGAQTLRLGNGHLWGYSADHRPGRPSLDRTNAWILLFLKPPASSGTETKEFLFCLSHFELGVLSFATEKIMTNRREVAKKTEPQKQMNSSVCWGSGSKSAFILSFDSIWYMRLWSSVFTQ